MMTIYQFVILIKIESIHLFVNSIWDTIKHEKDLNLPSQKQMIA